MTAPPKRRSGVRVHSRSRLAFDAVDGRTRLATSDLGAPLRVMRGFPLDDGRLLVQIISAAPGLFAGDAYDLHIDVGESARAVVITPAATKIHSMPSGGSATQTMRFQVGPQASLEIYPTLNIPFAESDFEQDVCADLAPEARFGWVDPWSTGRISFGERGAFRRLSTRLTINRDGRPLYRDALELRPESDQTDWGRLEGATHLLTGCWFGPGERWAPTGALDEPMVKGIVGDDGMYARGLFSDGASFQRSHEAIRSQAAAAWSLPELDFVRFTL